MGKQTDALEVNLWWWWRGGGEEISQSKSQGKRRLVGEKIGKKKRAEKLEKNGEKADYLEKNYGAKANQSEETKSGDKEE